MNSAHHPISELFLAHNPPTMPRIPAMRPLKRISSTVDSPMSKPPMSPLTGGEVFRPAAYDGAALYQLIGARGSEYTLRLGLSSAREPLPMYGVVEELIWTTEKGAGLLVGGRLTLFTELPRRGLLANQDV
jgi:hypothetical protein